MRADALVRKRRNVFSVVSNLAVTTGIAVDYSREDFFSRDSLNLNKFPSLQMDLKTTWSLQNSIFFSILRLKRALKSSECLPVQDNTHTNFNSETVCQTDFIFDK